MTTTIQQNESASSVKPGTRYRFTASSAEEAVDTVRERMGEKAKVVSVTQVGGQGLARFLTSPKLEIIAYIPLENDSEVKTHDEAPEKEEEKPPIMSAVIKDDVTENIREVQDTVEPGKSGVLEDVLVRSGFAVSLIQSLKMDPKWSSIRKLPISQALGEVYEILKSGAGTITLQPLEQKVVFIGTPGVGKTTALCKQLAHDVFLEQKRVQVLKMDSDMPNPDDALRVFCDVLGAPIYREPVDPALIDGDARLYIDSSGFIANGGGSDALVERMDSFGVGSRVLVVNAAYDETLIKSTYEMGHRMGATHVVFSHMDEVGHVAKLWPFLLHGGLSPLFMSHGQNVASDYTQHVARHLLSHTFPKALLAPRN